MTDWTEQDEDAETPGPTPDEEDLFLQLIEEEVEKSADPDQ